MGNAEPSDTYICYFCWNKKVAVAFLSRLMKAFLKNDKTSNFTYIEGGAYVQQKQEKVQDVTVVV